MEDPLDEPLLEQYFNQLESRECWTVNELSEFFDVSHTTIRKKIQNGEIEATKQETVSGYKWEIYPDDIKRNLSQSETLQGYLKSKVKANPQQELIPDSSETETNPNNPPNLGGNFTEYLIDKIEREQEQNEQLREQVQELQKKTGKLQQQVSDLKDENKKLRQELEQRPTPKALPAKIEEGRKQAFQKVGNFSTTLRGLFENWLERDLED